MKTNLIITTLLFFCFVFVSCAGKSFSYRPVPSSSSTVYSMAQPNAQSFDSSNYQPDMDDGLSTDEKIGGVFIGILGVGLTVAAIVVPLMLLD